MLAGFLLSLEGLDGCGKSTQARLLSGWLRSQGFEVVMTDEPTKGPMGRLIRRALRGELRISPEAEALLFASDRALHVANVILPALREGRVVVAERYVHSSLAYQSARGLPMAWIEEINRHAPKPDLTIVLDLPAEIAAERMSPSKPLDEFERNLEFQRRVRTNYLGLGKRRGVKIIDGNRPVGEVQADVRRVVEAALKRRPRLRAAGARKP